MGNANHKIAGLGYELITGDCRMVLPTILAESVQLVITDPPYFLDGLDTHWKKGEGKKPGTIGHIGVLPGGMRFDPKQGLALQAFIADVGKELLRVLTPGSFAVVFSQPRLAHRMAVGLEDAGFEIRDLLAWHFTRQAQFKAFGMENFIRHLDYSDIEKNQVRQELHDRKTPQLRPLFESMILAQKPRQGTFLNNYLEHRVGLINVRATVDGRVPATMMTFEKPLKGKNNRHMTVKPVPLIEHLIDLFSEPGQTVLDPFLGSGTTAIATQHTGRQCIGIEINPEYISIALERLQTEPQRLL